MLQDRRAEQECERRRRPGTEVAEAICESGRVATTHMTPSPMLAGRTEANSQGGQIAECRSAFVYAVTSLP